MSILAKKKLITLTFLLLLSSLLMNAFLIVEYVLSDSEEIVKKDTKEYEPAFITERKAISKSLPEVCSMETALTTYDMVDCLGRRIEYLNNEIILEQNRYIKGVKSRDSEMTEEEKTEYIKLLEDTLEQSNKDLNAYSESHCAFTGYKYYGGTLSSVTSLGCKQSQLVNHLAYIKVQNSI